MPDQYTVNALSEDPRGAAVEEGLIDGRAVAGGSGVTATAATTGAKFRGCLVSEDGDGTYTATLGTDDLDSAALAAANANTLDVPAGGVGVVTFAVDNGTTITLVSMAARGRKPSILTDGVLPS